MRGEKDGTTYRQFDHKGQAVYLSFAQLKMYIPLRETVHSLKKRAAVEAGVATPIEIWVSILVKLLFISTLHNQLVDVSRAIGARRDPVGSDISTTHNDIQRFRFRDLSSRPPVEIVKNAAFSSPPIRRKQVDLLRTEWIHS